MEGVIVINKPSGITSHDVVARIRKKFSIKKVGHAGTLDPLATGVLVVLVGKATKLSNQFVGFDKSYRSTMILGTTTDSADIEGEILKHATYDHIRESDIEETFKKFTGNIEQVPPMYSAVKVGGKKLYELARKGIVIERQARSIVVNRLELESVELPEVKFFLDCSKGTYVRQIAEDIGRELGCGACITQIQRTKVGPFSIEQSVHLEDVDESHLRNWKSS